MKTNFKFRMGLLVLLLAVGLAFPATVHAQIDTPPQGKGIGAGNFCAKVKNSKIDQQIATKISRLQSDYQSRQTKITQKRAEQVTSLSAKQTKWDANREQHFAQLQAKAGTDAEKTAVVKFMTAVNAAVNNRRLAVARAVQAFRAGVDQAILARRSALITVLDNYYKGVKAALDKAKTDCATDGTTDSTIRAAFMASMKTAQAKLQTEKSQIDKLGETIQKLAETKKTAITKAGTDIQVAIEVARIELEKAFPAKTE